MTALPEVNADEDKVILARARQQLELELKAREAKEVRVIIVLLWILRHYRILMDIISLWI